jgi:hypothetical protein
MTSEILLFDSILEQEGLVLGIVGSGVASVASLVATLAFLSTGRQGSHDSVTGTSRRDGLLAAALLIFVVAFVLQGLGEAIHAHKSLASSLSDRQHAAYWLDAISFWALSLGALCATVAFALSHLAARPGRLGAPLSRAHASQP